jgi:hypothetical protein
LFFYSFRASAALTALVGLVLCAGLLKIVINLPAVGVIGGFIFMALTLKCRRGICLPSCRKTKHAGDCGQTGCAKPTNLFHFVTYLS